jgi:hypothetical protein
MKEDENEMVTAVDGATFLAVPDTRQTYYDMGVANEQERLLADPELYKSLREQFLVAKMG